MLPACALLPTVDMRALAFSFLLAAFAALAEGPGTRIGTTPEVPPLAPPSTTAAPLPQDAKRCDTLTGARKEQCLAAWRTEIDRRSNGPQSIGGASGAGSSAGSGTTGGGSFGGSAPR
jgi:hypothetical protein